MGKVSLCYMPQDSSDCVGVTGGVNSSSQHPFASSATSNSWGSFATPQCLGTPSINSVAGVSGGHHVGHHPLHMGHGSQHLGGGGNHGTMSRMPSTSSSAGSVMQGVTFDASQIQSLADFVARPAANTATGRGGSGPANHHMGGSRVMGRADDAGGGGEGIIARWEGRVYSDRSCWRDHVVGLTSVRGLLCPLLLAGSSCFTFWVPAPRRELRPRVEVLVGEEVPALWQYELHVGDPFPSPSRFPLKIPLIGALEASCGLRRTLCSWWTLLVDTPLVQGAFPWNPQHTQAHRTRNILE